MPRIASVGTAVPDYVFEQSSVRQFAREFFSGSFRNIDRLLDVFGNANIQKRHFCVPMEWFRLDHTFAEKNKLYIENAVTMGVRAIENCLEKVNLTPLDIDCLIFISTTGIATPSIDVRIANILGMNRHIRRLPIWGMGCGGGTAGIGRALEQAKARPGSRVLLLTVELCGLTFLKNDTSKSNLIATSLFGEGAAAALIVDDHQLSGPRIIDSRSTLWPDTLDIMGWDVTEDGLRVIFSRDIPTIVTHLVRPAVDEFLRDYQLTLKDIRQVIPHPGGMKVITAYEQALDLGPEMTHHAKEVIRNFGNMSSSTVLFVLEKTLEAESDEGSYGLMTALGPGFCSELVLLQW